MIASLFLGLKEDLVPNLSALKFRSSFQKSHIRWTFLPYSWKSLFNFSWSMLLAEDTNFRSLDNKEVSDGDGFLWTAW